MRATACSGPCAARRAVPRAFRRRRPACVPRGRRRSPAAASASSASAAGSGPGLPSAWYSSTTTCAGARGSAGRRGSATRLPRCRSSPGRRPSSSGSTSTTGTSIPSPSRETACCPAAKLVTPRPGARERLDEAPLVREAVGLDRQSVNGGVAGIGLVRDDAGVRVAGRGARRRRGRCSLRGRPRVSTSGSSTPGGGSYSSLGEDLVEHHHVARVMADRDGDRRIRAAGRSPSSRRRGARSGRSGRAPARARRAARSSDEAARRRR